MQAKLLSGKVKNDVFDELESYLALRISLSQIDLSNVDQRMAVNKKVSKSQAKLIELVQQELENSRSLLIANGFYQSLSSMI
jgi:hypothetical protein